VCPEGLTGLKSDTSGQLRGSARLEQATLHTVSHGVQTPGWRTSRGCGLRIALNLNERGLRTRSGRAVGCLPGLLDADDDLVRTADLLDGVLRLAVGVVVQQHLELRCFALEQARSHVL